MLRSTSAGTGRPRDRRSARMASSVARASSHRWQPGRPYSTSSGRGAVTTRIVGRGRGSAGARDVDASAVRAVPPVLPTLGVMTQASLYEQVGGLPFFERLVDRFYDGVEADDVLLPLYPDRSDLVGARRRLALFLVQYWGGPTTYLEERGHPRLRARHFPFSIGALERDRWLVHMRDAIDASDAPDDARARLHEYM